MKLEGRWFTELCEEGGSAFSLKLKDKIYEEQTRYQLLEIYDTEFFGKLMTLDGLVMLTSYDNFIYHEMLTHPALFSHPNPSQVAVIGGGDCGCLREVLKHPHVESASLVELDERVTRAAERFFPELCEANNDPRASFHFTDGIQWMTEAAPATWDVIIIDSTDPVGPATGLYSEEFYKNCFAALSQNGVLIAQSESPLFHRDIILNMRRAMRAAGFGKVVTLNFPQCTYPSGWWTTTMATRMAVPPAFRKYDVDNKSFSTRYYNTAIHEAALAVPEFLKPELD